MHINVLLQAENGQSIFGCVEKEQNFYLSAVIVSVEFCQTIVFMYFMYA